MVKPANLWERAEAARDLAARARRLAGTLTPDAERNRLLRHAERLDAEAAELEEQARNLNNAGARPLGNVGCAMR